MRYTALFLVALLFSVTGASAGQEAAMSVSGTVVDPIGSPVDGARVDLTLVDGTEIQTSTSDAAGAFRLGGVRPGTYLVTIHAAGFARFITQSFIVTAQTRAYMLPQSVLALEELSTSVVVRPTEAIAAEEIRAQVKQRLFGVVPNFYVSYVPDAAPLTSRQKLSLAAHETFDWTAFIGASVVAATEQATYAHPGFGNGASGYAKRWVAAFADDRTGDLLDHYVFASVFRQDPRYFYQGTGTPESRMLHALTSAFVARRDGGGLMPNYAYVFGTIGAAALSNTYYPRAARGSDLLVTNVAIGFAGRAAANLIQEFVGKRLTKNVPGAHSVNSKTP
jgi:hypothetical protein